jgi:peptidyl-prolyl cis-trans isomerase C
MKIAATLIVICLAVLAVGCKNPRKGGAGEEILAQVGDVKITVKDFQDTINAYTPYLRSKYNTPEMKKKKLEEMVRFELLALEAKKRGYDKDPMVQRSLRQALVRELIQKEVEDKVKLEDITEEEMKKYYDEHPEKYHKPAQRRLAHILVKDRKTAEDVLKMALQDEMNAVKFRDLVLKYSEDAANKDHGGDLGYFSSLEERTKDEPVMDEKILKALYGLEKVGEIYKGVIETPEGFHIIKFTSTRPEIQRTYDQVKRQIQSIIWKDKREKAKAEFIKSLRDKAKVQIIEDALAEVKIPEEAAGPMPGVPEVPKGPPAGPGGVMPPPLKALTPIPGHPPGEKAMPAPGKKPPMGGGLKPPPGPIKKGGPAVTKKPAGTP